MKGSGGSDRARLHIKLEDSAIGYLVKKWNELEINVEGDAVTAEVVGGEASDPEEIVFEAVDVLMKPLAREPH